MKFQHNHTDSDKTSVPENPTSVSDIDFCDNVLIADKIGDLLREHIAKELIETSSQLQRVFEEINLCH